MCPFWRGKHPKSFVFLFAAFPPAGSARTPSLPYILSWKTRDNPSIWWIVGPSISLCLCDRTWTLLSSKGKPTVDELQSYSRNTKGRDTIEIAGPHRRNWLWDSFFLSLPSHPFPSQYKWWILITKSHNVDSNHCFDFVKPRHVTSFGTLHVCVKDTGNGGSW